MIIASHPALVGGKGVPSKIQWNPSITDTNGSQNFVRYREVSPASSGVSGIFLVGVGMCNRAVVRNVAAFSEISFAVRWQGRLVLRITALI